VQQERIRANHLMSNGIGTSNMKMRTSLEAASALSSDDKLRIGPEENLCSPQLYSSVWEAYVAQAVPLLTRNI
jgi:hypothetical protein